jgi:hypothetical protein
MKTSKKKGSPRMVRNLLEELTNTQMRYVEAMRAAGYWRQEYERALARGESLESSILIPFDN